MTMSTFRTLAAAAALATMAASAPAALVLQANGVEVLDTDTQLLWMHDWRMGSGDVLKTWDEGNAWAAALTLGGAAAGEWRMPEISEFEDLWASDAVGSSSVGLDLYFINRQTYNYWTATPSSQHATAAWQFNAATGGSGDFYNRAISSYTVAVRSAAGAGDPAGPNGRVPEPHTAALAMLGLVLAGASTRLRPAGRA
jgi:Protein of unknown function (DUF1566)/PEP-CTERM motif